MERARGVSGRGDDIEASVFEFEFLGRPASEFELFRRLKMQGVKFLTHFFFLILVLLRYNSSAPSGVFYSNSPFLTNHGKISRGFGSFTALTLVSLG